MVSVTLFMLYLILLPLFKKYMILIIYISWNKLHNNKISPEVDKLFRREYFTFKKTQTHIYSQAGIQTRNLSHDKKSYHHTAGYNITKYFIIVKFYPFVVAETVVGLNTFLGWFFAFFKYIMAQKNLGYRRLELRKGR